LDGLKLYSGFLDETAQAAILEHLRTAIRQAPLFTPIMPRTGKPFSVRMTNLGSLGWVSDREGYRYQATHPGTGEPWPAIPPSIMAIWRGVADYPHEPEACLVNFYRDSAKMGLHQDRDEEDFAAPVVSISVTRRSFVWAAQSAAAGRNRSNSLRAMCLSWAAQAVSPSTASTGSCQARPRC
jgi:DNA oxidative demethylase